MINRSTLITLSGVLAGISGLLAHAADVYTCWSTGVYHHIIFTEPEDILDGKKAAYMMATKNIEELAWGHLLAMVFIPLLGLFGTSHLYLSLLSETNRVHQAQKNDASDTISVNEKDKIKTSVVPNFDNDNKFSDLKFSFASGVVFVCLLAYISGTIMHCSFTFLGLIAKFHHQDITFNPSS
eukprot:Awhi_evm1s1272